MLDRVNSKAQMQKEQTLTLVPFAHFELGFYDGINIKPPTQIEQIVFIQIRNRRIPKAY